MMDTATVQNGEAITAPPQNEGLRWLRRHLAWERTILDCVERALDAQLEGTDQSTDGTSAQSRSSS